MTIVVFGASSKVGKAFNNEFKNYDIFNVVRNFKNSVKFKNRIFYKSLDEPQVIQKLKKAKTIINFTGESINSDKMFRSNVLFVKKLVDLINKHNKKCILIHLSTCGIYQETSSEIKVINEKTSPITIQKYAKTKYIGEQYILRRCKTRKVVLRPAQILGLGMSNQSLYRLKYYLEKNLFFYINNSNSLWSFTNINDVFKIIKIVMKSNHFKDNSLNLASTIKFFDLIKLIKKKYDIRSYQPTISLKILNIFLRPLELFKVKHPLDKKVIRSLTWDKEYSEKNISKLFKLSSFHDVEF